MLNFNHDEWAKKKEQDATKCGAKHLTFIEWERHTLIVGGRTKIVLEYVVCTKECAVCKEALRQKQTTVREHDNPQICEGSNKGMEASAALLLTKEMFQN
eukprot:14912937-Ditylum_brightwellii.AAC.1